MSIEKEQWTENQGFGCLSASQVGCALGLRGCISDFIQYERELKYTHLAFRGNEFTSHGIRTEPIARAVYEFWTGNFVLDGGFHVHHTHSFLACSPDGIVVNNDRTIGILEIKSPSYALYSPGKEDNMDNGIPKTYMCQMQCQMHITQSVYCDFFVYLHSKKDKVSWRVKRNDAWWLWALSKLKLVSRAIGSETVPEALQSRSFRFPDFDFEQIECILLIGPNEGEPYGAPLLKLPVGYPIATNEIVFLYDREATIQKNLDLNKSGIGLRTDRYNRSRTVKVIEVGTAKEPFFLVSDVRTNYNYRVLGKQMYPSQLSDYTNFCTQRSIGKGDNALLSRKRIFSEQILASPPTHITPLLHSTKDINEYYCMLDNSSNIHVVEGHIREYDKKPLEKLYEKTIQRFKNCTNSSFEDFMSCFQSHCKGTNDTEKSAYLSNLRTRLTDDSTQFIFIIGNIPSCLGDVELPPEWVTPTLVLPTDTNMHLKNRTGHNSRHCNIIVWSDGSLQHRVSVIEKYWN
ncbi:hypothetical protein XU18_4538 [Perkinsela sp. CCAP 1560/4]|nr:hypothetical protein XU18_4538 [Perkinsela sp. CCAP 1560/4]|eukprot:KNH04184.1 hypothetical protein XU18_4538 [Perkinsela sp. CCAP 1560/4]